MTQHLFVLGPGVNRAGPSGVGKAKISETRLIEKLHLDDKRRKRSPVAELGR